MPFRSSCFLLLLLLILLHQLEVLIEVEEVLVEEVLIGTSCFPLLQ